MTDFLHTANHEMGAKFEDVYTWLNDLWSYMDSREIITQVDPAHSGDMPNIILERGVLILGKGNDDKMDSRANYYKLVALKNKMKKSSKIIIIASELIRNGTFDTQQAQSNHNLIAKESNKETQYDDRRLWKHRYDLLIDALDKIEFIMVPPMPEEEIVNYRNLGKEVIMMPVTCNAKKGANDEMQLKAGDKYIDFCITGSMTAHRSNIVEKLRKRGYSVVVKDAQTPGYIRKELYNASWIDICPLLDESTRLVSTMKAKYSLDRNHIHLFEKPKDDLFCNIDILSEIKYNKGDFVEEACELLDYVKGNNIKYLDNSKYIYNSAERGKKFYREYTKMLKN